MKAPITTAQAMSHPIVEAKINSLLEMCDALGERCEELTAERNALEKLVAELEFTARYIRDSEW